jgi:cell pole-organizing protein PopZ
MSDPKPQQEPSMEEILASIRRIIAEDEKPADAAPPADTNPAETVKDDVLELTEMIEEDGTVHHVSAEPANPPAAADPPSSDGRIEPEPPAVAVVSEVVMVNDAEPARTEGPRARSERILSNAPSGAAAAAFARLATMPRERRNGDIAIGNGDRTLEDIVRETLRPLLQTWLDENLPALVERLVRAEIARVVGEAGLR